MTMKNNQIPEAIFQIKITLQGTNPPIWRRVLVPAELTLARLHDVLQAAMGWTDSHLHEFRIGRQRFGIPDADDQFIGGPPTTDERYVRLSRLFTKAGAKAEYSYDFGDGWEHALLVEKVLTPEAGQPYPFCLDGKLHGPPEDCGGIGGFYELLEAINDPEHERREELLEWVGGSFEPESFSTADVNRRLQRMFHPKRKTRGAAT